LTILSTIFKFNFGTEFYCWRIPEHHWLAASDWQILSHNVVLSTTHGQTTSEMIATDYHTIIHMTAIMFNWYIPHKIFNGKITFGTSYMSLKIGKKEYGGKWTWGTVKFYTSQIKVKWTILHTVTIESSVMSTTNTLKWGWNCP
jgi:hypothetical protein